MIVIFEDDKEAPASQAMLDSSLECTIDFSCGARKMEKKINEYTGKDDIIVCFYDLVPNNQATIKGYKYLTETFICNVNVIIVPIIGIEYYILKMLESLHINDKFDLTNKLKVSTSTAQRILSYKTLEKYYKGLLGDFCGATNKCFRNAREEDPDSSAGKFYTSDCTCDSCNYALTGLPKSAKGDAIIARLPVVPGRVCGKFGGVHLQPLTISDVITKSVSYYRQVRDILGLDPSITSLIQMNDKST